jgi:hypothetical protein
MKDNMPAELHPHFIGLASQKNTIFFYPTGMYASEELTTWFKYEYIKRCEYKLDLGKAVFVLSERTTSPKAS